MGHFEYQGFRGNVEFSSEDGCLIGRVAGINDVVSYEGESVSEIEQSFHDAVDTYLDHCKETGAEPQKPLSGKIPLRVDPELHQEIATHAQVEGMSLNAWITAQLKRRAAMTNDHTEVNGLIIRKCLEDKLSCRVDSHVKFGMGPGLRFTPRERDFGSLEVVFAVLSDDLDDCGLQTEIAKTIAPRLRVGSDVTVSYDADGRLQYETHE